MEENLKYKQYGLDGKVFNITPDEFNYISGLNCYICNRPCTEDEPNGIDRIINNIGYELENVAPCCTTCNYIKYTYNINDVIRKLYIIAKKHFCNDVCDVSFENLHKVIEKRTYDNSELILKKFSKKRNENLQKIISKRNAYTTDKHI